MIRFLYLIILIGVLIIEKYLSEQQEMKGLLLAAVLIFLGIILLPRLSYLGIIVAGVNIGRLCLNELKLLKLTALQDKIPTAYDQTNYLTEKKLS